MAKPNLALRAARRQQIVEAYKDILETEGYQGIKLAELCRRAALDKEQVYRAVGKLDAAHRLFATAYDYWLNCLEGIDTEHLSEPDNIPKLRSLIIGILQNQLIDYMEERALRELIAHSVQWEVEPVQLEISRMREAVGQRIFEHTDRLFAGTGIDFRGIAAILVGGNDVIPILADSNSGRVNTLQLDQETMRQLLAFIARKVHAAFNQLPHAHPAP